MAFFYFFGGLSVSYENDGDAWEDPEPINITSGCGVTINITGTHIAQCASIPVTKPGRSKWWAFQARNEDKLDQICERLARAWN